MIKLTVISVNGAPPAQPLAASFDERGGTIGRSASNQLALPGVTISREHAKIVCRQGSYAIVNCGTNPLALNGRTLAKGEEAGLRSGDQLLIGDYGLVIEAISPAASMPAYWNPPEGPQGGPRFDIGLNESEKAPPALGGGFPAIGHGAEPSLNSIFHLAPTPDTKGNANRWHAPVGAASPVAPPLVDSVPDHGLPFPSGGVFVNSWDPRPRNSTVIKPVAPVPRNEPVGWPSPGASPASADSGTRDVDEAALLAALREGLATSDVPLDRLTPELMRLLGELLRQAAQGTVDLLMARRTLKVEFDAETTVIRPQGNNPLKHSPTAEVALGYLLKPSVSGFVPGAPAMRNAYDDLRAHQYGMVAGMHAALQGVLQRFDPVGLESRLGQKSTLSNLLPAYRKAKLWELFTELYAELSAEAADDYKRLFGKAFLSAYEAHIDDLKKGVP